MAREKVQELIVVVEVVKQPNREDKEEIKEGGNKYGTKNRRTRKFR